MEKNNLNDYLDYDNPQFVTVRMRWFTPALTFDFALWYIINFYVTVIGFVFECFLLVPMLSSMFKQSSGVRNYYYILTCIIMMFDMIRFFIPADYRFSPSFFFTKKVADTLRYIYIVYGFFMSSFVPLSQSALTMNKLTMLMAPEKYQNVRFRCFQNSISLFRSGAEEIRRS